jgi:hypothetical protein
LATHDESAAMTVPGNIADNLLFSGVVSAGRSFLRKNRWHLAVKLQVFPQKQPGKKGRDPSALKTWECLIFYVWLAKLAVAQL